MKRLLLSSLLLPSFALAAPFVTTDPTSVAGITQCGVYLDSAAKVTIPVTAATAPAVGNLCKFDVGTVSVGSHSIQMTFITINDPIWGSQESAKSSPLVFVRPAAPTAPTGLGLVAQ